MKTQTLTFICSAALAGTGWAGDYADTGIGLQADPPASSMLDGMGTPDGYEAGRGLITLEGPSGMFINPTSATLPAGTFTAQYCIFFPDRSDRVLGHGALAAYGVTDWLEIGALGLYVNNRLGGEDVDNYGPFARIRLTTNDGWMPQIGVGGYARFGKAENFSAFAAAYWRIPINEDGFIKSVGIHAGARENWGEGGDPERFHAYAGVEVQLPLRLYLVSEITSKDGDLKTPYSFGVQWRAGGINISVAGIQNGGLPNGPAFYFGIGSGWDF